MIPIRASLPTVLKYCVIFSVLPEKQNGVSKRITTRAHHPIPFDDLYYYCN